MQKTKIYIDGSEGTTGLRIFERMADRNDIELISIDPALRKDPAARAEALNAADIAFLCLPDAASIEAAMRAVVEELDVKVKFVFQPVRIAVTGSQVSPPLCESMELLTREQVIDRINKAAEMAVD